MASTIDTSTKVQLGLLITILGAVAGGAWWASSMSEKVVAVRDNSEKTAAFSQRIYDLLISMGTTQALHAKDIEALRRDVDDLKAIKTAR